MRSVHRLTYPGLIALLALAGCSAGHYRKAADKEAYLLLKSKSALVKNAGSAFDIDQTNRVALEHLPAAQSTAVFLGTDAVTEVGARVLSLEEALKISVLHNRTYQSRKEQVYIAALGLSLARHQFTPLLSGRANARIAGQTEQAVDVIVDPVTQQPRTLLSDNLVEQQRVSGDVGLNTSWLIRDIGRLTASFSTDFLRFITGDPRTVTSSQVGATFARPLLRNAGFKQQMENLTQAERDLLYDLREFTQFRKDFSVQVATAYYGVLGNRDTVRNSFLNLESSKKNAERTRALAQEGRITQADLGRLEQQELDAENAWISAVRNYKQALDNFKLLQLGIPVATTIVLDDQELANLTIRHPGIPVDESIQVAMSSRLDLMNSREQHEDAIRQVDLAANSLKPQVDLVANAGFNSRQETNARFAVPDPARYRWSAGLDVDLPFDRTSERNAYRGALIAEKRSARTLEQFEDQIRLQVRESWRTLDQAKRSHEISELGVKIAERRADEQNLLAELGRAKAQDQVDAQNALNASKNSRTQALVTHTIARLQFWNNMGILFIKENGRWEELEHGKAD